MLDVAAITGLPASGDTIRPAQLAEASFGHVHAKGVYSKFLHENSRDDDITDTEHTAFLLYFFCRFFYGTTSVGVVQELQLFVALMIIGKVTACSPTVDDYLAHYLGQPHLNLVPSVALASTSTALPNTQNTSKSAVSATRSQPAIGMCFFLLLLFSSSCASF